MSAARRGTGGPRQGCPDLGHLPEGDPADLSPGADVSGVDFTDLAVASLDLAGALVTSTRVAALSAKDVDLTGTRLSEVELSRVDLPLVRAALGHWNAVTVNGRWGALEAYEAQWRSVRFVGCKLGFVNVRRAKLAEVEFTDCDIEELDLVDAQVRRLRFSDSRIRHLDVTHATLRDVDLRGAALTSVAGVTELRGTTLTTDQVTFLAPMLAAGLGIRVDP
ncbi:pentapeptide repeat-containing protein [Raineyella fluvialis]|uniref:Pentapeptide repeat-containing protein n=1 Tax=Raineyella fluvialis TaxID=2662261 RepID=A0A5Q2F7E6_9ACTN|nr:pentapeptide repeat-containing protein [Raineyella fluvialis]QGF22578.1 pentapeptide repeat-containing protein [Raineyella fluvialis]